MFIRLISTRHDCADQASDCVPRRADARRPVLFMCWSIGSDGRATCRWEIEDAAPARRARWLHACGD
jgi:hypothetical protein